MAIRARNPEVIVMSGLRNLSNLSRARHRQTLEKGLDALKRFEGHDISATDPAILAEDLRLTARALGRVTGGVGVEDILDKIFAQFCIGK